mmetsp:Transcript_21782/g.64215  ORF Transcript_21782/g.64215 Transcript_21782/m.64215 type:complete len:111 (-) Transcript_21782:700-1032(-)
MGTHVTFHHPKFLSINSNVECVFKHLPNDNPDSISCVIYLNNDNTKALSLSALDDIILSLNPPAAPPADDADIHARLGNGSKVSHNKDDIWRKFWINRLPSDVHCISEFK